MRILAWLGHARLYMEGLPTIYQSTGIHYITAKAPLDPGEELEYQTWHRQAAK